MVSLNFDARNVPPSVGFEPVPAGWYNVMIDDTELRPTKKADGAYLNVRFNILDGQYAGQKIFQRLNLQNPSEAAKEIAFKQLSALCHAVGMLQIAESTELHGKPLKVRVKVVKSEEYGDSNDITSVKNINDPTPGASNVVGFPNPNPSAVPGRPAAPAGWGAPVPPVTVVPPAPPAAPPPPAAAAAPPPPAADPYQYTPDGKQRWKPGMTTWELVPEAPAAAPPAAAGWTPPAANQPWAANQPPATPPAAEPPAATPPWMQQRPA